MNADAGGQSIKIVLIGFLSIAAIILFRKEPLLVPLLAIIVAFGMVAIRWPLIGLVGLVVLLLANVSDNLITNFSAPSLAKLALPGLVCLLAVRYLIWGDRPYIPWTFGALAALAFAVKILGAAAALHWNVAIDVTVDYAKDIAVVLVAMAFLRYRGTFEAVTATVVLVLAAISLLGLVQYLGGERLQEFYGFAQIRDGNGRFSGPLGDPNFFCALLAFGAPLAIFRFYNARSLPAFLGWGVVLALVLFGLVATQSRGGMLALCAGILVLFFSMNRVQIGATLVIGVAAVVVAIASLGDAQRARLSGLADLAEESDVIDVSTEGRLASWRVATELFRDNPIFGVGPGNFNAYYQDYALKLGLIFRGEGRSAHSLYLEELAESGMIGLFCMLLTIIVALISIALASRTARESGDRLLARHYAALGAAMVAFLSAMIFLHDSFPRFLLLMLALSAELRRYAVLHPSQVSPPKPPAHPATPPSAPPVPA